MSGEECCICYNELDETIKVTLKCKHNLCLECMMKLKEQKCPLCRGCCQFDKCDRDNNTEELHNTIDNLKNVLWDKGFDFCVTCKNWGYEEEINNCSQCGGDNYCESCVEDGPGQLRLKECENCDYYFCIDCFGDNKYCQECDELEPILKIASNPIFKQYLARVLDRIRARADHRKKMKEVNKSFKYLYGFYFVNGDMVKMVMLRRDYIDDIEEHYAKMRNTHHFIRCKRNNI